MPSRAGFWTSLAKVEPEVGCKVYNGDEVELVALDGIICLRVIPNKKRSMPILVELTPEIAQRVVGSNQVQFEELQRRCRDFNDSVNRQAALLAKKDEAIAGQLEVIRVMDQELEELRKQNQRLFAFGREAVKKLHNLRIGVLDLMAVGDGDPQDLWISVHEGLRHALVSSRYQMREVMSRWNPVRWFGGGDSLPIAFFLPAEEVSNRERSLSYGVLQSIKSRFAQELEPILKESFVSEEAQRIVAEGQK